MVKVRRKGHIEECLFFLQAHMSVCRRDRMSLSVERISFLLILFSLLIFRMKGEVQSLHSSTLDLNNTKSRLEIIRVIQPGIFDFQSTEYVIRMRAWGVSFPKRGQPGFDQAISFCEKMLLSTNPTLDVIRTFDEKNLKVVKVGLQGGKLDFTHDCIAKGIGWHNEEETGRFGPLILAQLKAKRGNLGVWGTGYNYNNESALLQTPRPSLPSTYLRKNQLLPQISYWVTSFGKIHRPGCSFYERGRGTLMAKPDGTDCRICGGRKGKR